MRGNTKIQQRMFMQVQGSFACVFCFWLDDHWNKGKMWNMNSLQPLGICGMTKGNKKQSKFMLHEENNWKVMIITGKGDKFIASEGITFFLHLSNLNSLSMQKKWNLKTWGYFNQITRNKFSCEVTKALYCKADLRTRKNRGKEMYNC